MQPYDEGLMRRSALSRMMVIVSGIALAGVAACASGRDPETPARTFAHTAEYRISCTATDECRVTYLDEEGDLEAREVIGEWRLALGADDGTRLWVRAGAGGCPPRPVRVEIWVDGRPVAEALERAPGGARCEWILAETEYTIP